MALKRIMIIGGPGSGKSTLAKAVGQRFGLPVIHLDSVFWRPGWVQADRETFNAEARALIASDEWVMDGNYSATWPERMERADRIIFLDTPKWLRMRRIFLRTILNYGRTRHDLAAGCPERFDLDFIRYALDYDAKRRPKALALRHLPETAHKVIHVTDGRAAIKHLTHREDAPQTISPSP